MGQMQKTTTHQQKGLSMEEEDRLNNFESTIVQYVMKGTKSRRKKVGVFFAGVLKDDPTRVAVGFSLCHSQKDAFDKAEKKCGCHIPKKGLGLRMAKSNALRWLNKTFVYTSESSDPPPFDAFVKVPASFMHSKSSKYKPAYFQFIERVKSYYINPEKFPDRVKTLPAWVMANWETQIKECGTEETTNENEPIKLEDFKVEKS